jgi:hypothetical protein
VCGEGWQHQAGSSDYREHHLQHLLAGASRCLPEALHRCQTARPHRRRPRGRAGCCATAADARGRLVSHRAPRTAAIPVRPTSGADLSRPWLLATIARLVPMQAQGMVTASASGCHDAHTRLLLTSPHLAAGGLWIAPRPDVIRQVCQEGGVQVGCEGVCHRRGCRHALACSCWTRTVCRSVMQAA